MHKGHKRVYVKQTMFTMSWQCRLQDTSQVALPDAASRTEPMLQDISVPASLACSVLYCTSKKDLATLVMASSDGVLLAGINL